MPLEWDEERWRKMFEVALKAVVSCIDNVFLHDSEAEAGGGGNIFPRIVKDIIVSFGYIWSELISHCPTLENMGDEILFKIRTTHIALCELTLWEDIAMQYCSSGCATIQTIYAWWSNLQGCCCSDMERSAG